MRWFFVRRAVELNHTPLQESTRYQFEATTMWQYPPITAPRNDSNKSQCNKQPLEKFQGVVLDSAWCDSSILIPNNTISPLIKTVKSLNPGHL